MYLNTHSYYSLRYGTIKPEALLQLALQYGVSQMALTDINTTSANLDFARLANKYGVKPILGVDFRNGVQQEFILLAKNNEGLEGIYTYLSDFLHADEIMIPVRAKPIPNTYVIYPFQKRVEVHSSHVLHPYS